MGACPTASPRPSRMRCPTTLDGPHCTWVTAAINTGFTNWSNASSASTLIFHNLCHPSPRVVVVVVVVVVLVVVDVSCPAVVQVCSRTDFLSLSRLKNNFLRFVTAAQKAGDKWGERQLGDDLGIGQTRDQQIATIGPEKHTRMRGQRYLRRERKT